MKGYMESGEFSRGKESIRAYGGIVMVGNFEVDVEHQQRIGHLFGPLPPEMRNDTDFMDRIHAYLPGWDVPKISEAIKTDHLGLVSDFLSECWSRLRSHNWATALQGRVTFGGALRGRDQNAVTKTINGLLKLYPPVADRASSRPGPRMAGASGVGVPAAGEGATKAHWSGGVSQHPVQLHPWTGWCRNLCGHTGAAKRRPDWPRSTAARAGVGHQSRRAGGSPRPLSD